MGEVAVFEHIFGFGISGRLEQGIGLERQEAVFFTLLV